MNNLLVNFLVNFFKKSWSIDTQICNKIAVFTLPVSSKNILNLFPLLALKMKVLKKRIALTCIIDNLHHFPLSLGKFIKGHIFYETT